MLTLETGCASTIRADCTYKKKVHENIYIYTQETKTGKKKTLGKKNGIKKIKTGRTKIETELNKGEKKRNINRKKKSAEKKYCSWKGNRLKKNDNERKTELQKGKKIGKEGPSRTKKKHALTWVPVEQDRKKSVEVYTLDTPGPLRRYDQLPSCVGSENTWGGYT